MEGIIILIVTIAAFLAMGTWALIKALKGPDLPKGHKFVHKFAGNKAIVVMDKNLSSFKDPNTKKVAGVIIGGVKYMGSEVAEKCAVAIQATEQAFKQKDIKKADVDKVVFHFQADDEFEDGSEWWQQFSKNIAAYSKQYSAIFGAKPRYRATIRSKYLKSVSERGQPAVHELVHILNNDAGEGYNHDHSDPDLWNGHGSDTVEAIGVRNWSDLVKNL